MFPLSSPDGEPSNYYLDATKVMLERYKGPLDLVIDLGAHIGSFAIQAIQEFNAKLVIAVEADPTNFSHLIVNIEQNQVAHKVLPIMATIDKESFRIRDLYYGGSSGQQSVTFSPEYCPHIKVLTLGLTDLLNFFGQRVDFLKVDIEGSEWQVFNDKYLDLGIVNYIDIEFHPTNNPVYHGVQKTGQLKTTLRKLKQQYKLIQSETNSLGYYGFRFNPVS